MAGVLTVRHVMTNDVKTVRVDASVKEAVQKMNKFNIGSVVVMDIQRRRPVGILTERDILRMVELYPEPSIIEVREVMSRPLVTVDPDTSIEAAARLMASKRIKRLPVVEEEKVVGIITSSDIMRAAPKLVSYLISHQRIR